MQFSSNLTIDNKQVVGLSLKLAVEIRQQATVSIEGLSFNKIINLIQLGLCCNKIGFMSSYSAFIWDNSVAPNSTVPPFD